MYFRTLTKSIFITLLLILIGVIAWGMQKSQKFDSTNANNNVEINELNLKKNLFRTIVDNKFNWLAVASSDTVYRKQYYSRDTFITFIGAIESNDKEITVALTHAIDWFGNHLKSDGYLPIWFQESNMLNAYEYCPYNLTPETGGIRQFDHQLEFMDSIYINYKKTKDLIWLKKKIVFLQKSLKYLRNKTDNFLLTENYSKFCGNDWADQILRSGKSAFVNAYWYKVNKDMAEMSLALGRARDFEYYSDYSAKIKSEYNREFYIVSEPSRCNLGSFGHYLAWSNGNHKFDYFELETNSFAAALGITDEMQFNSIAKIIDKNFDYFVNQYGATRTVCGYYGNDATLVKPGHYQNGAYWYITSYYLTMLLAKMGNTEKINSLFSKVNLASEKWQSAGLTEWYKENGQPGGAMNYSWSLGYPIFLASIINGKNPIWKLK